MKIFLFVLCYETLEKSGVLLFSLIFSLIFFNYFSKNSCYIKYLY